MKKIENEGVTEDVEVYQITTIGTHWKSEALVPPTPEPLKISNGTRTRTALTFEPCLVTVGKDETTGFVLRQLDLLLAKKDVTLSTPPGPVTSCVSNSAYGVSFLYLLWKVFRPLV